MFSPKNQLITGGNFTQITGTKLDAFTLLTKNVATQARHDTGGLADPVKCHPETRVAILTGLEEWASSETCSYPIRWISGSAGVGKTAIMRTTAEILKRRDLLLADFFFWRTGERCNNAEFLIATLSYQISISIPDTRQYIERAVERDPHIFSKNLESQSLALIVDPITALWGIQPLPSNYPRVFMVDGLDECLRPGKQSQDVEKQVEVLQVLRRILKLLPAPFYLLIASRPENHIQNMFDTVLKCTSSQIMLNVSYNADADIRTFYTHKFREIREHHPLRSCLPLSGWPSQNTLDELVNRACGQFIYASTVIKFIYASKKNPLNQLNAILDVKVRGNTRPFQTVDLLYSTIFSSIEDEDLSATLRILGILLLGRSGNDPSCSQTKLSPTKLPPAFWDNFLGLQQGEIQRLMLGLESVLSLHGPSGELFHFYHASLQDFLFDSSRSGSFYIKSSLTFEELARRAIHHLSTADDNIRVYISWGIRYWFKCANPSTELYNAINEGGASVSKWALKFAYPIFLLAIKQSSLPDTQTNALHKKKMNEYHAQLKGPLNAYLSNKRLVFLLLSAVHTVGFRTTVHDLINETCPLPLELALVDSDQGFHLNGDPSILYIMEKTGRNSFHLFCQEVVGLLTTIPDYGDIYAEAATFFVSSLIHSERHGHHRLQDEISDLFKILLQRASAQQGLSDCLKNHQHLLSKKMFIPDDVQTVVDWYNSQVENRPPVRQLRLRVGIVMTRVISKIFSTRLGKIGKADLRKGKVNKI